MRAIAVIPARLGSLRLSRKPLRMIHGKPLIGHVYEAVRRCDGLAEVMVATDSDEILEVCRQHDWRACVTSPDHASGTDRIHEITETVPADVYVNIQGDEPLVRPEHIDSLLDCMRSAEVMVGTLKTPCPVHDIGNPSVVKVVTNGSGRALYFSRAVIPFCREAADAPQYFKHLGFYAYRRSALDAFHGSPQSPLERAERLEQLRFLNLGIDIQVAETPFDTVGVDTAEDLQRVAEILGNGGEVSV